MKKNKKTQVTIIGNAEANEQQISMAYEVGRFVAQKDYVLISGGRDGVMGAAARGASELNGLTIGILPGEDINAGNEYNTVVIPSGIGFARNSMNVLAGDFVIAIGGGAGTLSEIAYAWAYGKRVFCYTGAEGWAKELAEKQLDNRKSDLLVSFDSIDELEIKIQNHL